MSTAQTTYCILHSKVKLGGNVSAPAGPVGRTAEANTDTYMRSEILTYSRASGLFAGVFHYLLAHPNTPLSRQSSSSKGLRK